MVSLYSTWWVKPGKEKAVKIALKKLVKQIKKNEKGTLMYLVHFPKYDFPKVKKGKQPIVSEPMVRPGTIIFMEKYKNWNAFKKHLYGKYFTSFVIKNSNLFVQDENQKPFVEVVFLDEEVGFVR